MDKDDFIKPGQTWRVADRDCPNCGKPTVHTNSRIHDCRQCDWWEVVPRHQSDDENA